MPAYSHSRSTALPIGSSSLSSVYGLFALAMGLTLLGIYVGIEFAVQLLSSGMSMLLLFAELALILTSRWWVTRSPLNIILFGAFPFISGLTITPYLLYVLIQYANGATILLNAFGATTCMVLAAALVPRVTGWQPGAAAGRALLLSVLGLLVLGIFQLFVPSLRGGQFEVLLSGMGVVVFALFTAYDLERVGRMAKMGANPFLLALTLYLDIFNLFLYVLRLLVAVSGQRR